MGFKWKKLKHLLRKKVCAASSTNPTDGTGTRYGGGVEDNNPCYNEFVTSNPPSERRAGLLSRSTSDCVRFNALETNLGTLRSTLSCSENQINGNHVAKGTCSICLEPLKPGNGQALFTAECSHVFHFSCIAANVRHGNLVCPICRARWKDVPWQVRQDGSRSGSHRRAPSADQRFLAGLGRIDYSTLYGMERRHRNSSFHFMNDNVSRSFRLQMEPDVYNDDEHLAQMVSSDTKSSLDDATGSRMYCNKLGIKVYSEVSSVPACESLESLTVLLHLNAPSAGTSRVGDGASSMFSQNTNSRAPIDLVAVLDTSGSMAGRKLVLLKQAMAFVIRNLSSVDRLSLVIFSSTAKRVFPLCRMGEEGQRQAIQSMDALMASGGTNIAEGLKKGVKILEDRRERNPISSIMLLSDGQDTYNINSGRQLSLLLGGGVTDSRRLVPRSIRSNSRGLGHMQIPIHTFGFGSDHDAATMHAISEVSGGTFSFIQAEETVQDAFAQCIGGLLSVVAQDVKLSISCLTPGVRINVIHAGSYQNSISNEGRCGTVELGDLYAEEQRDILVELQLPAFMSSNEAMPMPLLEAGCLYEEPVTREVNHISAEKLHIDRPLASKEVRQVVSLEVDRQRNRLCVAAVIAEARLLADEGNFEAAQSRLQAVRMQLEDSPSARAGDQLCTVLDFELKEMYERMASRQLYERSGRAYLLSAQSSHLRQRATTRGDSLDGFMHDYQTQSMVNMVTLSQMRSLLERNVVTATPSSSQRDMPRGRNAAAPTRSAGLSLFQKMSAKVLRSHGVG